MSRARARPGKTLGLGPPEGQPWTWMTNTMLGSITFRALGISARRILDFLLFEHAEHGGKANGHLAAPYRQLVAWGLTRADIRKGLEELIVTGFVLQTVEGRFSKGGTEAARYELTWLPTNAGGPDDAPPSHAWLKVIGGLRAENVGSVAAAKRWLRAMVNEERRGQKGPVEVVQLRPRWVRN